MDFVISSVDQSGAEAIFPALPVGKLDMGSAVGSPVLCARKRVGSVSRLYTDPVGATVVKIQIDNPEVKSMTASGCFSVIRVQDGTVELTDRREDLGKGFQYVKVDGAKLCKRFTGLSEFQRDAALFKQHTAKLPAVYQRPNRNYFVPAYGVPTIPMTPAEYRKACAPGGNLHKPVVVNKNSNAR
jgi:hypothetical protein